MQSHRRTSTRSARGTHLLALVRRLGASSGVAGDRDHRLTVERVLQLDEAQVGHGVAAAAVAAAGRAPTQPEAGGHGRQGRPSNLAIVHLRGANKYGCEAQRRPHAAYGRKGPAVQVSVLRAGQHAARAYDNRLLPGQQACTKAPSQAIALAVPKKVACPSHSFPVNRERPYQRV